MARPVVAVREATREDLPEIVDMYGEARLLGGRFERVSTLPTGDSVLRRFEEVDRDPHRRLLVATLGDDVVGVALLGHEPLAALAGVGAVHVHYLHVRLAHRRRGAGAALLGAAAAFAEECGTEHVVADVSSQLRDAQRFYARLGFGAVVTRRVVALPVLRRRLSAERASYGRPMVDELSLRRRAARARVRAALAKVAIE